MEAILRLAVRHPSAGEPLAQDIRHGWWCGRGDSNLHGIATASPSSWCVCQFRHYRTVGWYHSSYRMLTLQPPSVSKSFLSLPLSALRPKKSTTQVPDQETERYGFFVGA